MRAFLREHLGAALGTVLLFGFGVYVLVDSLFAWQAVRALGFAQRARPLMGVAFGFFCVVLALRPVLRRYLLHREAAPPKEES